MMLVPFVLLSLLPLSFAAVPEAEQIRAERCQWGVLKRREWRMLSSADQQEYLAAMLRTQAPEADGSPGFYDRMVNAHATHANAIHAAPIFLPWHRYFVRLMERMIQKLAKKPITIPYWNWALDSQSPEAAAVWSMDTFGTNGDPANDYCVVDGVFKNWRPRFPTPHCLRRNWSEGSRIGALVSQDLLDKLISTAKTYEQFRQGLEYTPHGLLHNNIGGDMLEMTSPNDPVFFSHHAFVDYIWAQWQKANPSLSMKYEGRNVDGTPAKVSDLFPGFKVKITVGHTLDTQSLCYVYQGMTDTDVDNFVLPPPSDAAYSAPPVVTDQARPKTADIVSNLVRRAWNTLVARDEPKDALVIVKPRETKGPNLLDAGDRTHLTDLRIPPQLPDSWLAKNGIPVDQARAAEAQNKDTIAKLNNLTGFVSPCALKNRKELLIGVVASGEASLFRITVNNTEVLIGAVDDDPMQATANIMARIEKTVPTIQKPIAQIAAKLVAVVGPPVAKADDPGNPFKAAPGVDDVKIGAGDLDAKGKVVSPEKKEAVQQKEEALKKTEEKKVAAEISKVAVVNQAKEPVAPVKPVAGVAPVSAVAPVAPAASTNAEKGDDDDDDDDKASDSSKSS